MLCKLLTCYEQAEIRRNTVFGMANLCAIHAVDYDLRDQSARPAEPAWHILDGLRDAFRYGPHTDPPLDQSSRGSEFAHPRNGSE